MKVKRGGFQERAVIWGTRAFGLAHLRDGKMRGKRLLEEAVEFAQSARVSREDCMKIVDYVYGRPPGLPEQELGGVAVTLLLACQSLDLNFERVAQRELDRVESKPPEHFTERNAKKVALFG